MKPSSKTCVVSKLRLLELDLTLGDLSGALESVGCEFRWLEQDLDKSALAGRSAHGAISRQAVSTRRSPWRTPSGDRPGQEIAW